LICCNTEGDWLHAERLNVVATASDNSQGAERFVELSAGKTTISEPLV